MGTLKINWWIASITAILLLFGAFVVVKAIDKESLLVEAKEKSHTSTLLWFGYDGEGGVTDEESYVLLNPQPVDEASSLCPGETDMCAIKAEAGSSNHPAPFSQQLREQIEDAINNQQPTANIKLQN